MSSINTYKGDAGNMCLSYPDLKINAGGAATIATSNAIVHTRGGVTFSASALSARALTAPTNATVKTDGTTMSQSEADQWRFYTVPAGKTAYLVIALDNAGTAFCFQGAYDGQPLAFRGRGAEIGKSVIPEIPLGFVPIGVIKVVGGSATWAPGDALDKLNVAFTWRNLGVLPGGATF